MERQRTRQTNTLRTGPVDDTPAPVGGAGLGQKAKGWGNAARQSRKNCVSNEKAKVELKNRRNGPGQ